MINEHDIKDFPKNQGMTFADYEEKARVTAVYPQAGNGNISGLSYTALGICGEAGEFSEKVKKYIRDGHFDPHLAMKELGDVLWYVSAAARELGVSLETIALININKLAKRKEEGKLHGSGDSR